jgi:prepilin-type N-terminal cleavage/methylation domain-containing protein
MSILRKGFTLIELLVVIGILAVLMAGVVALIDPVDKNKQALDSRSQTNIAEIATASESYAAQHNGSYAANVTDLQTYGELKGTINWPTGYSLTTVTVPAVCTTAAGNCTAVIVCGTLTSKKYIGGGTAYPFWRYNSATGISCPATACTAAGTCMP